MIINNSAICLSICLDPMWLLFDNEDKIDLVDELHISWNNINGHMAELEVAFPGSKPKTDL